MQMYLFPSIPALGIPATNGGDDGSRRLSRVHARVVQPARDLRGRQRRAELGTVGRDGRGVERLLRDGLPRLAGARARLAGRRRHRRPRTSTGDGPTSSGRRPSTVRRARPRPPAPARAPPDRAATRTGTSARSRRSAPRCTPTARSGCRRSGTSARLWGPRSRSRSSRGGWSSRRPSPRSWTCATRSSRPTRWRSAGAHAERALAAVRPSRDGVLRDGRGRQRRPPRPGLQHAADVPRRLRHGDRHGDRLADREPRRRRERGHRRARVRVRERSRRRDGRQRRVLDRRRPLPRLRRHRPERPARTRRGSR